MAGTVLTNQGRNLQAKAQAGAPIHYTKVVLGDGELMAGTSLENLTALINPMLTLGIQDVAVIGDGTSRVRTLVSNTNIDTGFFVREIGVFAQDPDEGEILYSIVNRGAQASFLQSKQGDEIIEQILDLITVVGNVNNVTAAIHSSLTLATKKDIEDHNADSAAHQPAFDKHSANNAAHQSAFQQHNADKRAHSELLHLWQSAYTYQVGDVVYSAALPSYAYAECIVAGTSAANQPNWPAAGEKISDHTVQWRIRDIKSGSGTPVGSILTYPADRIPPGYLKCDGAAVGRATYPELFAVLGTSYGVGDGSTTFNLPDLRGEFVRGWDDGRGVDSGRKIGSAQGDAIRNITGSVANVVSVGNQPAGGTGALEYQGITDAVNISHGAGNATAKFWNLNLKAHNVVPTASENRPCNVAMLYCIKAFDAPVNQAFVDMAAAMVELAGKVPYADFIGNNQHMAHIGWQKLPGGLIFQWGDATTNAGDTPTTVTFPVAYDHQCCKVIISPANYQADHIGVDRLTAGAAFYWTKTEFQIASQVQPIRSFAWFSLGY